VAKSNSSSEFEMGLRVGIMVGNRGRKEDKFADELMIAKITDVRHMIQQLVVAEVTCTLQELLKYEHGNKDGREGERVRGREDCPRFMSLCL
jgi:hypothetical protein